MSGAILMVLILIFISTRFIKYIQLAVSGNISSQAVFSLLGLQIPAVAGFLLPLSFFIAILLTFGRLYAESEMAIIKAVGIGEYQLAKNILPMAFTLAVIAGCLSFWVTPWAGSQANHLLIKEMSQAQLGAFTVGKFQENKAKSGVFFVESKTEENEIKNLFSVSGINLLDENNQETYQLEIQIAQTGKIWREEFSNDGLPNQSQNNLVLQNGTRYIFDRQSKRWQIADFEFYFMRLEDPEVKNIKLKNKAVATNLLLQRGGAAEWAEIHWRLSAPLSIIILSFLAIPLARSEPRKGKFSRLFPALMVYVAYALLMLNGRRLIEKGVLPDVVGFWWIHCIAIALCFWLYRPKKQKSRLNPTRPAHD